MVGDAAQPVYVVGGSLGEAFTPASVAGLVAWYDFADAATLFTDSARTTAVAADGDAIGGVTDKSGNAKHLTGTTTTRPLYKTAIQNSKSMALGDGVDDILNASNFASALTASTIFAIAKEINATQANKQFFSGKTDAARHVLGNISSTWIIFAGTVLNGSASNTNCNLWTAKFNGASSSIQINANAETTGNAGSAALDGVRLFASSATTAWWDGYVGEVCVYNGILSAGDIALVQAYLNAKWAVY